MKEITSVNNNFINELSKLKNKKDRILLNKYIIEGYHLVEEAAKTNELEAVLATDEKILKNFKVDTYLVTEGIIKKLSFSVTPQNIVGIVKMKKQTLDYSKIEKVLLLDDISDPGNLGTLIRTSSSLGFDTIILSNNTVDVYNDKVLRSTQGTIFKINIVQNDLASTIKELKKHGVTIYGTSLHRAVPIQSVEHKNRIGIILGNEAHGVKEEILQLTDQNVIIPMKNDVESLNIAIAGAICMWELSK